MVNVDIENMTNILNPNKLKLISKGIDSVKSRVVNLVEIYPELNLGRDLIFKSFEEEFLKFYNAKEYEKVLLDDENSEETNERNQIIKKLYEKYSSWDWIFGQCPEFSDSLFHKFDFGLIDLSMNVEKGNKILFVIFLIFLF